MGRRPFEAQDKPEAGATMARIYWMDLILGKLNREETFLQRVSSIQARPLAEWETDHHRATDQQSPAP